MVGQRLHKSCTLESMVKARQRQGGNIKYVGFGMPLPQNDKWNYSKWKMDSLKMTNGKFGGFPNFGQTSILE